MWDYSEKVMDHYRNPRNVGKIDDADAIGSAGSLTCGDQLKIYLKIKDGIVALSSHWPQRERRRTKLPLPQPVIRQ